MTFQISKVNSILCMLQVRQKAVISISFSCPSMMSRVGSSPNGEGFRAYPIWISKLYILGTRYREFRCSYQACGIASMDQDLKVEAFYTIKQRLVCQLWHGLKSVLNLWMLCQFFGPMQKVGLLGKRVGNLP